MLEIEINPKLKAIIYADNVQLCYDTPSSKITCNAVILSDCKNPFAYEVTIGGKKLNIVKVDLDVATLAEHLYKRIAYHETDDEGNRDYIQRLARSENVDVDAKLKEMVFEYHKASMLAKFSPKNSFKAFIHHLQKLSDWANTQYNSYSYCERIDGDFFSQHGSYADIMNHIDTILSVINIACVAENDFRKSIGLNKVKIKKFLK